MSEATREDAVDALYSALRAQGVHVVWSDVGAALEEAMGEVTAHVRDERPTPSESVVIALRDLEATLAPEYVYEYGFTGDRLDSSHMYVHDVGPDRESIERLWGPGYRDELHRGTIVRRVRAGAWEEAPSD